MRSAYAGRVPGGADLVTYWFEKARALVETGAVKRVGLISTNSIRNGANRQVLDKVKQTGNIFNAWSDRDWMLSGAAVNVSIVCFDNGSESENRLDGKPVTTINADLTDQSADVTTASVLRENEGISFLGMMKAGPFDMEGAEAQVMLATGGNPNGRPNSDVATFRRARHHGAMAWWFRD